MEICIDFGLDFDNFLAHFGVILEAKMAPKSVKNGVDFCTKKTGSEKSTQNVDQSGHADHRRTGKGALVGPLGPSGKTRSKIID